MGQTGLSQQAGKARIGVEDVEFGVDTAASAMYQGTSFVISLKPFQEEMTEVKE